jgi:hypothetical protein
MKKKKINIDMDVEKSELLQLSHTVGGMYISTTIMENIMKVPKNIEK